MPRMGITSSGLTSHPHQDLVGCIVKNIGIISLLLSLLLSPEIMIRCNTLVKAPCYENPITMLGTGIASHGLVNISTPSLRTLVSYPYYYLWGKGLHTKWYRCSYNLNVTCTILLQQQLVTLENCCSGRKLAWAIRGGRNYNNKNNKEQKITITIHIMCKKNLPNIPLRKKRKKLIVPFMGQH